MKYIFLYLLVFVSLFGDTTFEQAYDMYKIGDYEKSFVMFKALAKDNDDQDAAYLVAYMYENGLGCKKDTDEANRWYKISSNMYYSSSKEQVGRTIDKTNKRYFHSLDKFDGNETQETIRQMTRSLYNIKAYHTNYLIPASYRYRGKYAQTGSDKPTSLETEFQISMKFDFAPNLLKLNEIYSAAYTQKSFWQSYSSSAYFRESNYNPELFVTVPTASIDDAKLIKAFRLGIAHMSNGRGGVNERSWNYANATVFFQYKNLFTELKLWTRIPDNHDYNPHLIDYLGHGDIRFTLPYNKHLLKLLVRSDFKDHGALDLSYSYPLFGRKDLFVYLKAFSGYGESLIDYDNYVNKIGFGISISR